MPYKDPKKHRDYYRDYMSKRRGAAAKPESAPQEDPSDRAKLEARIRELKDELARERDRRKPAAPAAQAPPPPADDPASLSMTAQQKLEAYKRQVERDVTRKLEAQFEQRVRDEAYQLFDRSLEMWINRFEAAEHQIKEFGAMINRRKPILSRKYFRLFQARVPPDTGGTHDLAVEFNSKAEVIEAVLCGSKDEQREWGRPSSLARSVEELKTAREKRHAERSERAKRAAATRRANKSPTT
jgi:hypothetical protein